MTKGRRLILFLIVAAILFGVFKVTTGQLFPSEEIDVLMFSALLMLAFVTLFMEHFFTTPSDVLASAISILLLISPLHDQLSDTGIWYWGLYIYTCIVLAAAFGTLLLLEPDSPSTSVPNRVAFYLKKFATTFGKSRFLFFALFFLTLVFYVDSQSKEFVVLAGYSATLLLIDPKRFLLDLAKRSGKSANDIGEIIGVQSKNIFLARLYSQHPPVRRFDLTEFRYSMDDKNRVFKGIVVDNYLLNEEQWVKILATNQLRDAIGAEAQNEIARSNVVYLVKHKVVPEFLQRFVGVVVERSNIGKIRFDYAGHVPVFEGNLLEAQVGGTQVLYQVVQGLTEIDPLEQKNEAGVVVGEAMQLGVWSKDRLVFDKFGWVPTVNTPLSLAPSIEKPVPEEGEEQIGSIPGTNYPVLLNLRDAVTHHMALLGVTGSGKSVFCRDILRKVIKNGTKVICVDFTNEYRGKFGDLAPEAIVPRDKQAALFKAVDDLLDQLAQFKNNQNKAVIERSEKALADGFREVIEKFLKSDKPLALFELPDVANTTGILEYTKCFFRGLFEIARNEKSFGKSVCVVLEEAHTVIPEWNFIGVEEKKAQSLVNSIGQIALQGRKYDGVRDTEVRNRLVSFFAPLIRAYVIR